MTLVVRKDPDSNVRQTLREVHFSLPSPVLNFSLMRNLFSWAERLAINNYPVLSPDEILPLSALTLSLCANPSFGRIIQNLDQLAQETLVEDEPKITVMLQEVRGLIEVQIDLNRAQQAKVQLQRELRKKALQISKLKEQASILYFNNGGRETKQKIDEAMVIAAAGALNSRDQAVIDLYWKAVASNPWGTEWHPVIEKGVYGFFRDALQEGFSLMSSLDNPLFKKAYGFYMKKSLHKSIKKVAQQWLLRRIELKFEGDLIKLNYMILKGKLWKMPLTQHRLKQILEPIIFNTEQAVQNLARRKEAQIQKEITEHLEELNSPSCCIDPEAVKKQCGLPCSEGQLEDRLNANKTQRDRCLKELEELQAYTFKDHVKWARQEWGYDPNELRGVLADETPFDRKVIEVLSLTSVIEDEAPSEEEMKLDLNSLPDPVAYFAEKMQKRDEQALALFCAKIEEVRLVITSSS